MANCGRSGAVLRRGRVSVLCALLVLGGVALFREDAFHAPGKNLPASSLTSTSLLARLPLVFEPNVGQSNQPVKFLARGRVRPSRREDVGEKRIGEIEDIPARHVEQITFQEIAG